jgi:hypothetical protein
MNQESFINKS